MLVMIDPLSFTLGFAVAIIAAFAYIVSVLR